jgi:demethylmenaquinone methyltransferase/2-methoxy-6-polyprenyl-1,4-benzoquinol methylase
MKFSIWNHLARIYDRTFTPILKRDIGIIRELGDFKKSDAVLDFGGGTGRVAQAIKNDVARVVVVDAAPKMVARARQKGIEAEIVSGLPTRFSDASFDKVLVIEAFHHMSAHEAHIVEFCRVLKLGGALLIEEPDPRSWIRWFFWVERLFEPTVYHAPDELRLLLEKHDFSVEQEQRAGFSYFIRARKR